MPCVGPPYHILRPLPVTLTASCDAMRAKRDAALDPASRLVLVSSDGLSGWAGIWVARTPGRVCRILAVDARRVGARLDGSRALLASNPIERRERPWFPPGIAVFSSDVHFPLFEKRISPSRGPSTQPASTASLAKPGPCEAWRASLEPDSEPWPPRRSSFGLGFLVRFVRSNVVW